MTPGFPRTPRSTTVYGAPRRTLGCLAMLTPLELSPKGPVKCRPWRSAWMFTCLNSHTKYIHIILYFIILYYIIFYINMHMYVYIYIASTSLFYFMCVSREFSTGKPQIHAVHASEFVRKVGCKCKVMLCRQWVFSGYMSSSLETCTLQVWWGCLKIQTHEKQSFSSHSPLEWRQMPRFETIADSITIQLGMLIPIHKLQ